MMHERIYETVRQEVTRLRPGDLIVIRVRQQLSDIGRIMLREQVAKASGGYPVLVVDDDAQVELFRQVVPVPRPRWDLDLLILILAIVIVLELIFL